jgi:hypothetical protein
MIGITTNGMTKEQKKKIEEDIEMSEIGYFVQNGSSPEEEGVKKKEDGGNHTLNF